MDQAVKPTVLVVEDDSSIRFFLNTVLSAECEILLAADGASGLALAQEAVPDLVLLDVELPDMNGFDICRQLKSDTRLASVPVIFLTGRTSDTDEIIGFEAGGIDYIAKPINPGILRARVRNHLEMKRNRDALERMARLDGLTGIANRRTFDDMLTREWRRLARVGQPLAVIMMDVDHFKLYNDTYGHGAGDTCLKRVAQAAVGSLQRPADVLARYGGEEFVALLPDTALAGALAVAEGIRDAVAALRIPHKASKAADYVTLSLGAACRVPNAEHAPTLLMEAADEQLYAAKTAGRNRAMGISLGVTV